ncbi:Cellulase domain-containing protein [Rhizoctonia solani AG-1 IA]|uniref:Cellulase domain-containing protein n=1 Tax=Thanatephorus cucumeris (strain AG1-IA) TaxID=983506 RepID=L8X7Q0_THACA|nr:Cellulase domain-containing protein [Rhizoctonia solani AG-1 IA]
MNFLSYIHPSRAIVGETGGGQNANCYAQIKEMLNYLAANDEYIGWTGWAAGPLWGTFRSCCGDDSGNLEPGTKADNLGQWIPAKHPEDTKAQWDLELELRGRWTAALHATGDRRNPVGRNRVRQIIRTTTQECWIVRRPLSDDSADSFRYISNAHGRRGADLFMETTTAEGTSGMPQTTLVPPSILPPDFLDADIDDIVNLIGADTLSPVKHLLVFTLEHHPGYLSKTILSASSSIQMLRLVGIGFRRCSKELTTTCSNNLHAPTPLHDLLSHRPPEFLEKIDWRLTVRACARSITGLVKMYQMGEALAKNVRQDPVTLESYQANGNGPDKTTPSPPRSPATSTAPSSVHQVPCANAPPPPISTKPFAQPQPRDTVASPSRTILAGVTSPSLRRAGRSPVTGPSRSIPSSPSLKRARDGTEDIMPSLTNAHLRKMEESSPRTRRRTGTNSS